MTPERMKFFRDEWERLLAHARELVHNMERDGIVGSIIISPILIIEHAAGVVAQLEEREFHLRRSPPWTL